MLINIAIVSSAAIMIGLVMFAHYDQKRMRNARKENRHD